MARVTLERHQVWIYLTAIILGLVAGTVAPDAAPAFGAMVWPALMALLTVSFTQVPLGELPAALRDRRFLCGILLGNFVAVPLLVWALLPLAPTDPAVRLGMLLVLLVPCTDWFIAFAQLGRGDIRRAIAATPVNLLAQMALLPVYLWLFLGESFAEILSAGRFVLVFLILIVVPLVVAFVIGRASGRHGARADVLARLAWWPVPLLAGVIFLIAAGQADAVMGALPQMGRVAPLFLAYLAGAVVIALMVSRLLALPVEQARTLVFSLATRNSFVVLPFALAMPRAWEVAAMVIVLQSLVELFGMIALVRLVPGWLLPARPGR